VVLLRFSKVSIENAMRYIDSATRVAADTLGQWLQSVVAPEVAALRVQVGFYSLEATGLVRRALDVLRERQAHTAVLIGANDGMTLAGDLSALVRLMGLPRPNANLGVVSYAGAYFHPKVYHVVREDGSQAAYVGSANLTAAGVSGLHIEAGITLDTREGDQPEVLSQIAQAVDTWFLDGRAGLYPIRGDGEIDQLVAAGIVRVVPPPRTGFSDGDAGEQDPRTRLRPLIQIPSAGIETPSESLPIPASGASASGPTGGSAAYPDYFFFAVGATSPTRGAAALTDAELPENAAGLIFRLNRDNARHFFGGDGTSNISIPIGTVRTIRFGVFARSQRPRAEFDLELRYISDAASIMGEPTETNVMPYGYAAGEPGHKDIRLLAPRAIRDLATKIGAAGYPIPGVGDVALLEWPNSQAPAFSLTYLDRRSSLHAAAIALLENPESGGPGSEATWLPHGFSPAW
jgi:hypothetical protein